MATNFQTGIWYYNDDCKQLMDWCLSNNKPFFAYYTNLGGAQECTNCEKWRDECIEKAEFMNYMKDSVLYYGEYNGPGNYAVIQSYMKNLCKYEMGGFPSGFFYKDSTYHQYFNNPSYNKTQSSIKSISKAYIRYPSELIPVLKNYEFQLTQYKVTFKDFNGAILKSEQLVVEGQKAIPPPDPIRDGYTFVRWDPSYQNITSDRICIAQYTKNKNTYKVTFKDEDGTILKGPIDVDEGDTALAPTPLPKTGKTFDKWNPSNVNIQSDTICIACYISQSGLYSNTITKRMFYNNRKLEHLSLPIYIEHIDESAFEGCLELTMSIPSGCKTIGNRAFYNCKDMNNVKIPTTMTSIGSEALASSSTESVIDMTSFSNSSSIPTIQSNSFLGYEKIKFANVNASKHFYGNSVWRTYYSIFDPKITYIVSYNANGGIGSIDSQEVVIGEKWICKSNAFNRDKYDFVNFNSMADGSGTTYVPGQLYDCPSSNMTLYAIWKEKKSGTTPKLVEMGF